VENVAIIYRSKYGTTRQYAHWLATELGCDIFEARKFQLEDLEHYDTMIYGAPVYGGGVTGVKLLRTEIEVFGTKHLVIFTCGMSDPLVEKTRRDLRDRLIKALTSDVMAHIKVFYLRGAIDYKKLRPHHRIMMAMRKRAITKKDTTTLSDDDRQFLATYGKSVDFTDEKTIRQIAEYVRQLNN
jgi:menaquinone-dependent protoporphyrinogen IX oxidase